MGVLRLALAAWLAFGAGAAWSHALAPSLLQVEEAGGGRAAVLWKTPTQKRLGSQLKPVLPEGCLVDGTPRARVEGTGRLTRFPIQCERTSLEGARFAVQGMEGAGTDVLVRVVLADGRSFRHVLTARRPSFVVPERESVLDVALGYGRLGLEHILSGLDHLCFVLALVLLVPRLRELVATVTSFTVGHSITLALAAFGAVQLPGPLAELGIALSIVWAGVEILRRGGEEASGAWASFPIAAGLVFGLLHGLGFAGALREIGLPQEAVPLALFAFNVGIELGQLAFVAVVALPLASVRVRWPATLGVIAYAIGALGGYWAVERAVALVGPPG